jgi:hypothetical protein
MRDLEGLGASVLKGLILILDLQYLGAGDVRFRKPLKDQSSASAERAGFQIRHLAVEWASRS